MPSLALLAALTGLILLSVGLAGLAVLLPMQPALRWLERTQPLRRSAEALAQAEMGRLPALWWVTGRGLVSILVGFLAWVYFGLPILAPVAGLVAYHGLAIGLERRRRRLEARRQEALLDALRYGIAVMGRAGNTMQMVRALAENGPLRARDVFGTVVNAVDQDDRLTLAAALDSAARRLADPLFDDIALAITINLGPQGGRLVPALERVLADWEKRWELRRRATALRAGQELSVRVLAFLPFGLLACFQLLSPPLLDPLHTGWGQVVLALVIAAMTIGYRVMQRKTAPPRDERLRMASSSA